MSTNILKLLLLVLVIESIIFVLVISADKKQDDSLQTCNKDDEVCKKAAQAKLSADLKAKESADPKAKSNTGSASADTSSKSNANAKPPNKSNSKAKPKSKTDEVADCPLCSYTRPLIKKIMEWIKELLSDPMLVMMFNAFKDQIWELGKLTKQFVGFRLF